ncbi:hypothetical protein Pint_05397 [Pistacia integerrima]|uniref:Uncharacterized protein n=1 Tax=Pistacia integerrima TaxID=434235 RepID=A0ACC0Z502_9ROSI|nr:hypothetical protein Pint_05397 [Pistacia integerrima]
MVSNSSYRKSFIDSSIRIARRYGFQGLDFAWQYPNTSSDMFNMGVLFQEFYPIETIQQHLNWVHVSSNDFTEPLWSNLTGVHASLYDPSTFVNTDYGIREWINGGLSANKLVFSLPLYGFAWTLMSPINNGIGAAATGPAVKKPVGGVTYREI